MAKWCGNVGYADRVETEPGIWEDDFTVRMYYGDVQSNFRSLQGSGNVNDNLNISNKISIVADPYAMDHFHNIRYVEYASAKWKVTNVEVMYPRLMLTLGGVWN